ncbi:MAG: hypothetical protein K6E79_06310 [Pseudobutyrivibrio sp.]|nr:hypothetical protein [Pseudobutyrivibrio sp.]
MSLTINSFGYNSISSLFGGTSSSSNSLGLAGSLTDLSLIKSGAYGKLTRAYYDKIDSGDSTSSTDKSSKANTAATSALSEIKNDSAALSKATDELLAKDKNSIWNKVETTDENGNTTTDYDKDKIYKALSSFVDAYNDLVDSGQEADSTNVLTQVAGMVTGTSSTLSTLGKAGIYLTKNNHLEIDEDFLKNDADMTTVKDLFNGTGSYAYQIATKASMINSYANSQLSDITGLKSYNSGGSYSLSTADMLSAFNTTT